MIKARLTRWYSRWYKVKDGHEMARRRPLRDPAFWSVVVQAFFVAALIALVAGLLAFAIWFGPVDGNQTIHEAWESRFPRAPSASPMPS